MINEVFEAASKITGYKELALLALSPIAFKKLVESIQIINMIEHPKETLILIKWLEEQ